MNLKECLLIAFNTIGISMPKNKDGKTKQQRHRENKTEDGAAVYFLIDRTKKLQFDDIKKYANDNDLQFSYESFFSLWIWLVATLIEKDRIA
ncbi:MAG: hypothetical protein DRR42_21315, partial [Gammaproteobacteria bacterium]